jgi:hypothetical protein
MTLPFAFSDLICYNKIPRIIESEVSTVKQDTQDLIQTFRNSRNQCLVPMKEAPPNKREPFSKGYGHSNIKKQEKYDVFLDKYNDLENTIDTFNSSDLVYFFREKAQESEIKYVIANIKRDLGIFKKLLDRYSAKEICLMVEFLFISEQNYLKKESIQPTLLLSAWCNKIYQDSLLWVDDKYTPDKIKVREWQGNPEEDKAEIGVWK